MLAESQYFVLLMVPLTFRNKNTGLGPDQMSRSGNLFLQNLSVVENIQADTNVKPIKLVLTRMLKSSIIKFFFSKAADTGSLKKSIAFAVLEKPCSSQQCSFFL